MDAQSLQQQRLQKLKNLEEQKRKQKNAKLGMLTTSEYPSLAPKQLSTSPTKQPISPGKGGASEKFEYEEMLSPGIAPSMKKSKMTAVPESSRTQEALKPKSPASPQRVAVLSDPAVKAAPLSAGARKTSTTTKAAAANPTTTTTTTTSTTTTDKTPRTLQTLTPLTQYPSTLEFGEEAESLGEGSSAEESLSGTSGEGEPGRAGALFDEMVSPKGMVPILPFSRPGTGAQGTTDQGSHARFNRRNNTDLNDSSGSGNSGTSKKLTAAIGSTKNTYGAMDVYDPIASSNNGPAPALADIPSLSWSTQELWKNMDVAARTALVQQASTQGRKMLCKISRRKDGLEKLYPSYELFLELPDGTDVFLMAARKRKKSTHANYILSTEQMKDAKTKECIVGKVRSNFLGTEFTIFDNGYNPSKPSKALPGQQPRKELACVIYEPNILGFKGPRKMTVVIPGMTREGQPIVFQPRSERESLLEKNRSKDHQVLALHNKSPQWSEETQSYVLNFYGRVTMASVKNFQIVHDNDVDYVILQFGRVGPDTFTLDFQYPMSPLQAFSIAMSSFDAKLACE